MQKVKAMYCEQSTPETELQKIIDSGCKVVSFSYDFDKDYLIVVYEGRHDN